MLSTELEKRRACRLSGIRLHLQTGVTNRHWTVICVLDGDSLFPLPAPTQLFLHDDEGPPEAVIGGIAYGGVDPSLNRRSIDFSAAGEDGALGLSGHTRRSDARHRSTCSSSIPGAAHTRRSAVRDNDGWPAP